MCKVDKEITLAISPIRDRMNQVLATKENDIPRPNANLQPKLWKVEPRIAECAEVDDASPGIVGVISIRVRRGPSVKDDLTALPKKCRPKWLEYPLFLKRLVTAITKLPEQPVL